MSVELTHSLFKHDPAAWEMVRNTSEGPRRVAVAAAAVVSLELNSDAALSETHPSRQSTEGGGGRAGEGAGVRFNTRER